MPYYSRNCVVLAKLENGLNGGSGAVITIGAHTGGVLPVGAATVTTAGTGYPASRTVEVWFQGNGGTNAIGRITTNSGGAITSATVDDGGSGYTNNAPAVFTMVATPNGSYGVYTGPTVASDGVLVGTDFKLDPEVITVDRDVYTGSMGGKQSIPGEAYVQLTFTIELAGSGAAISEPAWALFLKAAGAAGTLTAATKWDYTPITDQFPSLTLRIFRGGYEHRIKGARVTKIDFDFSVSTLPTATLTIIGIEGSRFVASLPSPNLSAWKTPIVITDANTADIKLGSSYNNSTGAITGGTGYGSKGLKLTWDNSAKFRPFLGGSGVPITNREITGSMMLDLAAADNVAFYNAFKASTLTSLSFQIGFTSGAILKVFMPSVERNNPTDEDDDGLALSGYTIRARPTAYGLNDEIRLVSM